MRAEGARLEGEARRRQRLVQRGVQHQQGVRYLGRRDPCDTRRAPCPERVEMQRAAALRRALADGAKLRDAVHGHVAQEGERQVHVLAGHGAAARATRNFARERDELQPHALFRHERVERPEPSRRLGDGRMGF